MKSVAREPLGILGLSVKISIAMATYNGSRFLREQLDSFLTQTRLPDEVIISDDCSADETLQIVRAFAERAPFSVVLIKNRYRMGCTANFSQALMKAKGDLVFLSDQDDVWLPIKIERMVDYAQNDPASLVLMNDAALTDVWLGDTGLTKLGQIASAGLSQTRFVMGACAAVRRELLEVCLPIPAKYRSHDSWIVGMADGIGRRRVFSDVLQFYRRHEENVSHFIANRTRRVTRLQRWAAEFGRLVSSRGYDQYLQEVIDQEGVFLRGVLDACARSAPPTMRELEQFARRLERRVDLLTVRLALSRRPRWRRSIGVLSLVRKGAYEEFSGLKTAIQDLISR